MNIEQNQHDDSVDKVFAALRDTQPPEGMETRIARRLAQHPVPKHRSALRDSIAAFSPTAAWWRGAITGAAFATLAICAALLLQHRPQPPAIQTSSANNAAAPFSNAPQLTPASQSRATPCAHSTMLRAESIAPAPTSEDAQTLLAESNAPSHPAPELPLTPQERQLARLVHTADPNELASLSPETDARREAEDAAELARIFAPPTPPPTPEVKPEANPASAPEENQTAAPESESVPPATE